MRINNSSAYRVQSRETLQHRSGGGQSNNFRHFNKHNYSILLKLLERLLSQIKHHYKPDNNSNDGTRRNDRLKGTNHSDTLHGRNGNDHIQGRGGNDKLYGDNGNDKLFGGNGNDKLFGGNGNDRLYGGKGNDKLQGGRGKDVFIDNRGNNTIDGGQGRDEVRFSGKLADYDIMVRGEKFIFQHKTSGSTNTVSNVERFTFKDQGLSLSTLHQTHIGGKETKYHSIDGSFNNLSNPDIGKVDSPFRNLAPKDHERAIGGSKFDSLPNPREISNKVFAQTEPTENRKGLSDMFWLWGQFVDHDINLTPTLKSEPVPIAIPKGDPLFDPQGTGDKTMGFDRSVYILDENGVRKETNHITAVIDGSNIYGSSEEVQNKIRSFAGGKLIVDAANRLPKENGQFLSGDVRVNENVGLTSMHTLWVREHNRIADDLADKHPRWNDNKLFQETRKKVVGEMQAITANEFLPNLFGGDGLSKYKGYNPNVSPQVSTEFATAAYRFGHTMLSPTIYRLDENGSEIAEGNLRLRDAFFRPDKLEEAGVDPIFRGFAAHTAQAADAKLVDDVRNFLFGQPGSGGFDLASLNIQRGRDHGIATYNDSREAMGLHRITSFDDPIFKEGSGQRLASVYDSTDDIELWVGGLAEKHYDDGLFGSTFTGVLKDQFERTRDGDRFWYQNRFSGSELKELNQLKLSDIIERNTGVESLQNNVFVASNNINQSTVTNDVHLAGALGANGIVENIASNLPVEDVVSLATNTVSVTQAEADKIIVRALEVNDAETALAENTVTTTTAEIDHENQ